MAKRKPAAVARTNPNNTLGSSIEASPPDALREKSTNPLNTEEPSIIQAKPSTA
jgi:hypothetical protein